MVVGIQLVGILFGFFMLYLTFVHRKRKEFTVKEFVFWWLLWLFFVGVAILPSSLDFVTKEVFRLQRPLDLLIITGSMFMVGSLFYTYALVRVNQKKLEDIVRQLAIKKAKK